jgi:hypothetical protein
MGMGLRGVLRVGFENNGSLLTLLLTIEYDHRLVLLNSTMGVFVHDSSSPHVMDIGSSGVYNIVLSPPQS